MALSPDLRNNAVNNDSIFLIVFYGSSSRLLRHSVHKIDKTSILKAEANTIGARIINVISYFYHFIAVDY
jgi:hypothetical protein